MHEAYQMESQIGARGAETNVGFRMANAGFRLFRVETKPKKGPNIHIKAMPLKILSLYLVLNSHGEQEVIVGCW